uniref:Putative secreted protein n=1 Tax=Ixodes ricinus TaxID=34613 RepID=A0A6B0UGC1_IXORI
MQEKLKHAQWLVLVVLVDLVPQLSTLFVGLHSSLRKVDSVQKRPAQGDVAFSDSVQQFGNIVQDKLLYQGALLQQLLQLRDELHRPVVVLHCLIPDVSSIQRVK